MVKIYKQKLTILQQEILRVLFVKLGISLNQKQIAYILEVSQPAVKKAIPYLRQLNFINVEKDKNSKRLAIELNRENHKITQLKIVDNLEQIYETGLVDFLEKEFAGGTIILFGSYYYGRDTINSDIDIAIIGRNEKTINLKRYERQLERKINLNFYSSWKKTHKHLKENIFNGIILSGGIEL